MGTEDHMFSHFLLLPLDVNTIEVDAVDGSYATLVCGRTKSLAWVVMLVVWVFFLSSPSSLEMTELITMIIVSHDDASDICSLTESNFCYRFSFFDDGLFQTFCSPWDTGFPWRLLFTLKSRGEERAKSRWKG
jgi:hypothetical protein